MLILTMSIPVCGTLALLRAAGCHVTIATMTPGDCGSAEHDAETISTIRRARRRHRPT